MRGIKTVVFPFSIVTVVSPWRFYPMSKLDSNGKKKKNMEM